MAPLPSELYTRYCRPLVGEMLAALRLDVVFHRGEGDSLFHFDDQGREHEVTDFLGGYGALVFGHNHPELTAVAIRHFETKIPLFAQLSCRAPAARLGARLSEMMLARTGRAFVTTLSSTGAEAVEAAMKHAEYAHRERIRCLLREVDAKASTVRRGLAEGRYRLSRRFFDQADSCLRFVGGENVDAVAEAMRHHDERGFETPSVFLSLRRAFHGKTLGALGLTHHAGYRTPFARAGSRSTFVEGGNVPELEAAIRSATIPYVTLAVDAAGEVGLVELGHVNVAALFVEPLQGEGGMHVTSRDYLQRCRELASEHAFPLVFDEIQSGMGRTGTFLFSEQLGVVADYYTLSKGLGGGVAKVSALLVEASQYERQFGLIHTSTFGEDDLGSAVALRALELLEERPELMRNCVERGHQIGDALMGLQDEYPDVIDSVRGVGLMIGVEFRPQEDRGSPAIGALFAQGLFGYVVSGYLLHEHGLRIAPCMSNRAILRIEPSALIGQEACGRLVAGSAAYARSSSDRMRSSCCDSSLAGGNRGPNRRGSTFRAMARSCATFAAPMPTSRSSVTSWIARTCASGTAASRRSPTRSSPSWSAVCTRPSTRSWWTIG
jgi:acetylornithine/succinyldiaminopimelate/putrescine aminotransferase